MFDDSNAAQTANPAPTTPTAASAAQNTQPAPATPQPDQQQQQPAPVVSNGPAPSPNASHPLVQKAGVIHDALQALTGGPHYQTSIDPTTGSTVRTQVPVSTKSLGMLIALEALGGAMTGLAQRGPNHVAAAGAAGFQQGQQQAQQMTEAEQQQAQQAQNDFARRAAITNTNFQTHQNALRLGQMEYDTHKQYVSDAAPVLDSLNQVGAIKAQGVHESDLIPQFHVAKDMAVVDGIVPRMNADGTQAKNPDGSLAWDNTYSVIDPDAKIALPDATAQLLADYHVPGYFKVVNGKSVPLAFSAATPLKARMVVDGLATASAIKITDATINQQLQSLGKDGAAEARQFEVNLKDSLDAGSVSPKALRTFARYSGMPLDLAFAQMLKDKVDPDTVGQLAALIPADAREQLKQQRIAAEEKAKRDADIAAQVAKEKALIPVRAQTASAEERARQAAKPQPTTNLTGPDALGFTPTVTDAKEANKRFGTFKKNLDALSQTEQSYGQFQDGLAAINAGNWNGAQSVVNLFSAIGLSAAPLAGRGFRVNQNVIAEHQHARGWMGELQARLQGAQTGAIITPQQLRDYAGIAQQARTNQYISLANEMHNAGINADAALPTGNGQHIDADTARIFLSLTGGNKDRARQAAIAKGWSF